MYLTKALLVSAFIAGSAIGNNVHAQTGGIAPAENKSEAIPALISTADFVDPGVIRLPKISPNGQNLVYRQTINKTTWLSVRPVTGGESKSIAMPKKHSLNWYRWAGDDFVIFSLTGVGYLFGEEVPISGIMSYQPSTKQFKSLGLKSQGPDGDDVLYVDPNGQYLLLSMQPSIYDYPDVYRVNIADGKVAKVIGARDGIWDWIADDKGVVRMGLAYSRNTTKIYYRSNEQDKFKLIGKVNENDDDDEKQNSLLEVNRIVSGQDQGYVLSNKETGRFALYKFNYLTREVGEKVFGHDENDITDFELNDDGTALESVSYTDSRDRIVWFDEAFKKHQRMLDKALPGQEAWISSHSRDRNRMIIYSTSSTDPGSYYLYDASVKHMVRLAGINDKVDPAKLPVVQYVNYPARDGLSIPAYLALPKGREAKNLPLIILPHGGPYGVRDTLDYDTEVQFLANRGYAVLQPNFRGSESYGEAFYKKGEGQIGRTMQDDLDDGMDWLAKQGTIDPKRVCIVGASYGGYAALWGVIRNPERYRCAASFAGVTDFKKQLKYSGKSMKSRYAKQWSAIVRGEESFDLDLVSPARQLAKLDRPVLITHGDDDSNVPFSQFKTFMAEAKKAGKTVDSYIYEGEGHGFDDPANEKDWLDRLEAFLAKHNPADAVPAVPAPTTTPSLPTD